VELFLCVLGVVNDQVSTVAQIENGVRHRIAGERCLMITHERDLDTVALDAVPEGGAEVGNTPDQKVEALHVQVALVDLVKAELCRHLMQRDGEPRRTEEARETVGEGHPERRRPVYVDDVALCQRRREKGNP